jgi:thiol:disulfide interchange protein DsbD
MIKKIILLFLVFIAFNYAEGFGQVNAQVFLKPEDAFKVDVKKTDKGLRANIIFGKDIYIYRDSIKFNLVKPVTKTLSVTLPKPTLFHDQEIYENVLTVDIPTSLLKDAQSERYELSVAFEGCSKSGVCYAPINKTFTFGSGNGGSISKLSSLISTTSMTDIAKAIGSESSWLVLLLFFVVGLLLALTPCVFPMIPILSSIIISQSSGTKPSLSKAFFISLVYVLAMSMTYAIVGIIAGLAGFDMQAAMQNPFILIIFTLLFIALAMSLFGFYEIGLPARWQTKISNLSDSAGNKGGIIGTAIMGMLSALIVGPCVAPALGGAVLFISQSGDAMFGGLALFVMSFGMGIPLLLVGIGAGKWMPRPGGWMMLVSRFFGIVMLGIAIMMISRITTPAVTMLLSSSLALFTIYGIYKNRDEYRSKIVKFLAFAVSVFLVFLSAVWITGALSGGVSTLTPLKYQSLHDSSHGKKGYSVDTLLDEVKTSQKPVIVDFTKESCAACKELDVVTFADPRVKEMFKNYTFIQVDLTDNTEQDQEMLKYFGIFGTPNILFFDKNGEFQKDKTITGFIAPDKFIQHLKSIQ